MKICCLKGSPRKNGNTNALTDIVLGKLTHYSLYGRSKKGACGSICQEAPARENSKREGLDSG